MLKGIHDKELLWYLLRKNCFNDFIKHNSTNLIKFIFFILSEKFVERTEKPLPLFLMIKCDISKNIKMPKYSIKKIVNSIILRE